MTLYEVQLIRDKTAPEPKVEQEIYAVEDDSIFPLIEHLDTEIRSSNTKIIAINFRCKVTKHIK